MKAMVVILRRSLRFLVLILIFAAFLRFYRIDNQSLWMDEVVSLKEAAVYGSALSSSIWRHYHGPLYYLLLHYWVSFWGTNDMAIRSLSAIIGAIGVLSLYLLGAELFNKKIALISTFILSISPFHIWYSQEVRAYILVMTLATLSMYSFVKLLKTPHLKWAIGYFLMTIFSLLSFAYLGLLVLSQNLYILINWKRYRNLLKVWVCSQSFLLVALSPFLFILVNYFMKRGFDFIGSELHFPPKSLFQLFYIGYTFFAFSAGFSIGPSVSQLRESLSLSQFIPFMPVLVIFFIVFAFSFFRGIRQLLSENVNKFTLISLWLGLPILALFTFSFIKDVSFHVRYVSMTLPAYILVLSNGTSKRSSKIGMALFLLISILSLFSLSNYFYNDLYVKEDMRSAARCIQTQESPNQAILFVGVKSAFQHYYNGRSITYDLWKPSEITQEDVLQVIGEIAKGYKEFWLVYSVSYSADRKGFTKMFFNSNYKMLNSQRFPGVEVFLYRK